MSEDDREFWKCVFLTAYEKFGEAVAAADEADKAVRRLDGDGEGVPDSADVITVYQGANSGHQVQWDQSTGAVRVLPDGFWVFPHADG